MSSKNGIMGNEGNNQGGEDNSHLHGYGNDASGNPQGGHMHQVSNNVWSRDTFDSNGNYQGTEVDHQKGE